VGRIKAKGAERAKRDQPNHRQERKNNQGFGTSERRSAGINASVEGDAEADNSANINHYPIGSQKGVQPQKGNQSPTRRDQTGSRKDPHRQGQTNPGGGITENTTDSGRTSKADDRGNVVWNFQACGPERNHGVEDGREGSASNKNGNIQVGPVWEEVGLETNHGPGAEAGELGNIPGGTTTFENNIGEPKHLQPPNEGYHSPEPLGLFFQRDWKTNGAYSTRRRGEKCTPVCHTLRESTGNEENTGNVETPAYNVILPLEEQSDWRIREDHGVTWDRSRQKEWSKDIEEEKIGEWHVQRMNFTKEEWELLKNYEVSNDIEMRSVMYSSSSQGEVSINGNKVSEARRDCNLPLAEITKNRINIEKLRSLPIAPPKQWEEFMEWITTDKIARELRGKEMENGKRRYVSRHLEGEWEWLSERGIIKEQDPGDHTRQVPLFKVPKADGGSRLIANCKEINGLLPRPGPMGLPGIHEVIETMLQGNWLWQVDARSYFYQFQLAPEAAEVFGVRIGGKRGQFRKGILSVLPMGFTYAPGIAQWTSWHIARNVLKGNEGAFVPWVDNFLGSTKEREQMSKLQDSFYKVSAEISLECKEAPPPTREMDAVGLHFDVSHPHEEEHFVTVTDKYKEVLRQGKDKIRLTMTARDILTSFGQLMWPAYAVGREPLCRYPRVMNLVRRVARGTEDNGWEAQWNLTPEESEEFKRFYEKAQEYRLTLRDLQLGTVKTELWTDASSFARGYVKVTKDRQHEVASVPHEDLPIFVAELLAAAEAILTLHNESEWKNTISYIDNQAAVTALNKGHSASEAGDLILRKLDEKVKNAGGNKIQWIKSDSNIADAPSRGRTLSKVTTWGEGGLHIRWKSGGQ
jgi:hypothetical protein